MGSFILVEPSYPCSVALVCYKGHFLDVYWNPAFLTPFFRMYTMFPIDQEFLKKSFFDWARTHTILHGIPGKEVYIQRRERKHCSQVITMVTSWTKKSTTVKQYYVELQELKILFAILDYLNLLTKTPEENKKPLSIINSTIFVSHTTGCKQNEIRYLAKHSSYVN